MCFWLFHFYITMCWIQLMDILKYLKVALLWIMKGSYFGFGSPQQQVDMHVRSKNTFIFLKNAFIFTLFAQGLPNYLLLCVTLICSDWSISFKAVFVSF